MRDHYDFSKAKRGQLHKRYAEGTSVRVERREAKRCVMVFPDGDVVDASTIGELLFLLRGAYAAGVDALYNKSGDALRIVSNHIRRLDVTEIDSLFTRNLGAQALLTKSLSHNSPLTAEFVGAPEGLLAAIVLAHKSIDSATAISEAVDMPPVTDAIRNLREALVPGVGAPLGFGIRAREITLSKDELKLLLALDPKKKDGGGFQRLLIRLQQRVNRTTGRLELFEPEMNTIIRNGRNPTKGGWQRTLERIFGRHFHLLDNRALSD